VGLAGAAGDGAAPAVGVGSPTSWNRPSVNAHPAWHAAHRALPTNRAKPRRAGGAIAAVSPATQRSNGASGATSVR
jgi:hypothetical protein